MNSSDQFELVDGYVQDDSESGKENLWKKTQKTIFSVSESSGFLREQDRFLPIANIAKIMKKAIPNNCQGKIAKDARECVQECVSEFISFITSEASERCANEKRKTMNGEDILWAMTNLGFDNYIDSLKIFLQKYRDASKSTEQIKTEEGSDTQFDKYLNGSGGNVF